MCLQTDQTEVDTFPLCAARAKGWVISGSDASARLASVGSWERTSHVGFKGSL